MFLIRTTIILCVFLLALPLVSAWTGSDPLPGMERPPHEEFAEVGIGDFLDVLTATAGDIMGLCERKPAACSKALDIFDALRIQAIALSAELHARLADAEAGPIGDPVTPDDLL